jgi:hypothetical protein
VSDLISALQVFAKYTEPNALNPTHCEHDVLQIMDVDRSVMAACDVAEVERLGFYWEASDSPSWISFRFGSA